MKAVIRAEVDPSGVVSGVARAQAELRKLNAAAASTAVNTGVSAAIAAAQVAARIGTAVINTAQNRVQTLQQTTTAFNTQAANAATMAQVADFQRSKRLADSLAPDVIRGIQAQTAYKDSEAARMLSDPLLGPGLANSMAVGAGVDSVRNQLADDAIGSTAMPATLMPEVVDLLRNMTQLIRDLGKPF
jgi:hypothetical protein